MTPEDIKPGTLIQYHSPDRPSFWNGHYVIVLENLGCFMTSTGPRQWRLKGLFEDLKIRLWSMNSEGLKCWKVIDLE
jgi:hypothetical protein